MENLGSFSTKFQRKRSKTSSVPTFWDLDGDEAEEQRDAAQQAHRQKLRSERVGRHDGHVSLLSPKFALQMSSSSFGFDSSTQG